MLYFDLLGIASMARNPSAIEYLLRLRPALEDASDHAATDDPGESHASTWFTDNLVVATPIMGHFQDPEGALLFTFVNVSYFFLILLKEGFLGRGGIGFGDHYMDERFVFGPALIDAVEVEKCTNIQEWDSPIKPSRSLGLWCPVRVTIDHGMFPTSSALPVMLMERYLSIG